ncbi:fused sensory histidine kinase in two-component regulatory system with KdpE: signal sensing protein; sensory histidine kinase [Burkholderiales bacterium]|nr:fused sensory histidine kinase in two-component regulatory system with KdpE: signal sensing protein; sensory histidine kinase [Burkholderiales bacterium]
MSDLPIDQAGHRADDQRPDPDALLARIQNDAAKAQRGRLRIFFGASAGVGKTYAMLSAARVLRDQGVDVVVGVVETHGRAETEAMAAGLERLPLKEFAYRDRVLLEFDLDAALARKPALILVDELAHSNVEGSRHPKRWQDVEELLGAGISVYSTVNVQHLETLNDVVSGITGIRVWETIPDRVFDQADEVVLVDLTPDELLQRLRQGKVYLAQQAERAIRNFFRKGNLIALRELALRRTADRVDVEMLQYRRDQSVSPVWQTRESLLACVGLDADGDALVRSAARIASRLDVPWHAVYIETPRDMRIASARHQEVLKLLKLAQSLGAETATLAGSDAVATVVKYARDHNLSRIVVGRSAQRRWQPWRRTFADRLASRAPDLEVTTTAGARGARPHRAPPAESDRTLGTPWTAYLWSAVVCAVTAVVATPLYSVFELPNIVMIFLLAVVLVAVRYGRGPAVLASFLSVAEFDFFFVPPRFSFAVSDVQYLLTFAVMLIVGLIAGQLTAGLTYQARVATRRESRVRALYEMARDLSGALLPEQIAEICDRFIAAEFGARSLLLLTDDEGRVVPPPRPLGGAAPDALPIELGIAQWAVDHGEAAGLGTDTLPASPVLYLPLKAPMRLRGLMAIEPQASARLLGPEQGRLLDTVARLIAIALERVHYVEVAQNSTLQMESERLRNSLLSAISHDLRTPLAALVGLADSLRLTQPPPSQQQGAIVENVREQAGRLRSLVENLLDMARLQAGRVALNRQWHSLEEMVGTSLRAMAQALGPRQVRVHLPADLPLVEIDAALMERVLCNLLENAAKFTLPSSHIDIGATAEPARITVWVEDDGPGLPPGREEEIFKKFERGHKESATPGVGLGLAICRAIIEAHGGTIRAENRPGGGARFLFELPSGTPPNAEEDELPEAAPAEESSLTANSAAHR